MNKVVARYTAQVQEVKPHKRNAQNQSIRILPHGTTYAYEVEAKGDANVEVGEWYEFTLYLSPVAYKDKDTGKAAAFITAWLLEATHLPTDASKKSA